MARQKVHIRNQAPLKLLGVDANEIINPSNRGYYTRNPKVHRKMNSPKKQERHFMGLHNIARLFARIGVNITP